MGGCSGTGMMLQTGYGWRGRTGGTGCTGEKGKWTGFSLTERISLVMVSLRQ